MKRGSGGDTGRPEPLPEGEERLRRIEQTALTCLTMCEAELMAAMNDVMRMQEANETGAEANMWLEKEADATPPPQPAETRRKSALQIARAAAAGTAEEK